MTQLVPESWQQTLGHLGHPMGLSIVGGIDLHRQ